MNKKTIYWITFISPGSFTTNEWSKDCDEGTKPEDVEFPENAYAFRLMKREDVIDGENTYEGKAEIIGKTNYHPDSKIMSLEEVKADPASSRILISNMEGNNWEHLIFTRWGNWPQPYKPEHTQVLG